MAIITPYLSLLKPDSKIDSKFQWCNQKCPISLYLCLVWKFNENIKVFTLITEISFFNRNVVGFREKKYIYTFHILYAFLSQLSWCGISRLIFDIFKFSTQNYLVHPSEIWKSFPVGNFLANITAVRGPLPLIPYKFDPQFIFPCTVHNLYSCEAETLQGSTIRGGFWKRRRWLHLLPSLLLPTPWWWCTQHNS